jgi:SAM-dependent methyltransferase
LMIKRALELNQDRERVRFHHHDAPNLRLFDDGSFDFILSLIVLQHMEPELMRGYLREFLRVLRPGGVAFFDVPDGINLDEELPPQAWRASLTLMGTIPQLAPGQVASVTIKVRNDSPIPWPSQAGLRVGDHWRTPDGRMVVFDDARTAIDSTVEPGGEYEIQLRVVAPGRAGEYELEVDLVQELIGWFADRGSTTLRVPVAVTAEAHAPVSSALAEDESLPSRSRQAEFVPQMEVHLTARAEVVTTLEDAGGVVLDVVERDRCGPALRSLDYIVARAVSTAPRRPPSEGRSPRAVIEARIRGALEHARHASRGPSRGIVAEDPEHRERHALALRLLDERADLVGFALTSGLKGAGRASVALREALRRGLLEVLHRQTEHNRASAELIRSHDSQLEALGATVRAQLDLQAAVEERLVSLERRLASVEVDSVILARREARGAARPDFDYLGFTKRLRGTREEIKKHQRRYLPRFAGVSEVVDAGCGRGEFLELLREAGIGAVGVDRDEAMVDDCRRLGLDASQDDALHFLHGRPERSHGGIFAAHLLEQLEQAEVVEFVRLAFSRLRPGGVLVIEAVNPMCLVTHATYHDNFTRIGPLPPLALKWLTESCGFAPIEIDYSSPVPAEHKLRPLPASAGEEAEVEAFNRGVAAANDLLFGFQEYALVARKPA